MSREFSCTAIVLKKQPFHESDELITFFTRERGKVRALAKSIKLPKSRLQSRLQSLFLVNLRLAGGHLPKVIGAEPGEVFAGLREDLDCLKPAFYAAELALKFTPDEQKNEPLFELLVGFLDFLNRHPVAAVRQAGLLRFKIGILETAGFAVRRLPPAAALPPQVYFSRTAGGFVLGRPADGAAVTAADYIHFERLAAADFAALPESPPAALQDLFSGFIEYQLERRVKSESFLRQIGPDVV